MTTEERYTKLDDAIRIIRSVSALATLDAVDTSRLQAARDRIEAVANALNDDINAEIDQHNQTAAATLRRWSN